MEAVRGQTPYSDGTLWHFNSMFGPSLSAKVCGHCIVDDLCGTLIGLVHSPLVQNFMENLVTTLVSSISLPLFSANNIYDGTFY